MTAPAINSAAETANATRNFYQGIPTKVANALSKVGLNSIGNWTGSSLGPSIPQKWRTGDTDAEVFQPLQDGFSYYCFIVRADQFFPEGQSHIPPEANYSPDLDLGQVRRVFSRLRSQILRAQSRFPEAVFIISLKGYHQVGGWDALGIRQSFVDRSYEESTAFQEAYAQLWEEAARILRDVPTSSLVFNLFNEPEWHTFRGTRRQARDKWLGLATGLVDRIREISPNRVIIIEGISKGMVFFYGNTPDSIHKPIDRDGIIYAFTYYRPNSFTHQETEGGFSLTNSERRMMRRELAQIVGWSQRHQVPLMLSEAGIWGPHFEDGRLVNGALYEDRAEWASILYQSLVPNRVGITWWALHDNNTPYRRLIGSEGSKIQPSLQREPLLWEALNL